MLPVHWDKEQTQTRRLHTQTLTVTQTWTAEQSPIIHLNNWQLLFTNTCMQAHNCGSKTVQPDIAAFLAFQWGNDTPKQLAALQQWQVIKKRKGTRHLCRFLTIQVIVSKIVFFVFEVFFFEARIQAKMRKGKHEAVGTTGLFCLWFPGLNSDQCLMYSSIWDDDQLKLKQRFSRQLCDCNIRCERTSRKPGASWVAWGARHGHVRDAQGWSFVHSPKSTNC